MHTSSSSTQEWTVHLVTSAFVYYPSRRCWSDRSSSSLPRTISHNNRKNIVSYGNRWNGWLEECLIADRCGDGSVFVPAIVSMGLPVAWDEDTMADSRRPRHHHIHNGLLLHHPSLLGRSSSPSKRQCPTSSARTVERLRSNSHRSMAQVTHETKTNS